MLQDLQTEIDILKRQKNELESELLDKLMELEKNEHDLDNKKSVFQSVETRINSLKALLTSERDNLIQKIKRLETERLTAKTQISPDYQKEYAGLISTKQGIAVGTIQDNSCSACGTTFTPSQCQTARSQNDLFHCPTCHRIIYGG